MLDRLKEFSVKHRLECPDSHFRFSLRFRGLLPLVPRAGKENFCLAQTDAQHTRISPNSYAFLTCTDLPPQESQESPPMPKLPLTSKWWAFQEKNRN
jgi:hypothetical protein